MVGRRGRLVLAQLVLLLALCLCVSVSGKKFLLVLEDDDGTAGEEEVSIASVEEELRQLDEDPATSPSSESTGEEWESLFDLDDTGHQDADPGSWKLAVEEEGGNDSYTAAVAMLASGASNGDPEVVERATVELRSLAQLGDPHAQSTLASLFAHGYGAEQSDGKAFIYHHFAAQGDNLQSKMALAYSYYRQQRYEEAAVLYEQVAAGAMSSLVSAKEGPLMEQVRLNDGPEVSKETLKKFRGEDDDDFQFLEYQAQKGNPTALYKLGLFYYYGLRGIRRDHSRALFWFSKAVEKGDSLSLEFLGEIYARGLGVPRNYTSAFLYFKRALRERRFSAYNGLGYLYFIGKGVEQQNLSRAKEFFKKAADHKDPNGFYNLGVLYLKGVGVKKNVGVASRNFVVAANSGHPKAYYQLAKMQQKGISVKKDLASAVGLYKLVAERGPWGSLLRLGLECYLKGDVGLSLLLYSRAAELGYEVAQSNAAWILDKHREEGVCLGKSGICSDKERHIRAHALWRLASEQGNEYAALLIGDAFYYGRGTERDLERAAEAYMRARLHHNAQAMFNIGYMHEHGLGLPRDYHLAKRYYDQALEADPMAVLPVWLSLGVLWLRQRNEEGLVVKLIDMLPELIERSKRWIQEVSMDDGNATLVTLVLCLVTVLYLRSVVQRRRAQLPAPPQQVPAGAE